jgi:hypothetical protein
MRAKSIKGKSPEEIKSVLQESMADARMPDGQDFKPTLAIVFISIKQDRTAVCNILHNEGIDVFGATSCGEFIDGHQSKGEIVILLMDLSRDSYAILFEDMGERSIQKAAKQVAASALTQFANPAMIVCSTGVTPSAEMFDGTALVHELSEAIGKEKIFFGGMAGDDFTLTGTSVFTQNRETNHGLVALVLNADKVSLNGMAITGWKRLGISRKVTRSKGKLLYSIDGKPAVDMYLKYLGKGKEGADLDFDVLNELSFDYPFIVERENSDEIVIKGPMSIDREENALVTDMEMKEGEKFWFSVPPDFDIVQEIIDEATNVKNSVGEDADALLVFSCAGREPALGPLVTMENEGLAEVWNSPMAGFFTYGEYGRAKNGQQHYHSTACCWVALKEK